MKQEGNTCKEIMLKGICFMVPTKAYINKEMNTIINLGEMFVLKRLGRIHKTQFN